MSVSPSFPPLFSGLDSGVAEPFRHAAQQAALGCDSGLVCYRITADRLSAAVVFAPEVPLEQACAMWIAAGVGFSNALGALAPPEVGVHLEWAGPIRVNGARCGRLRMAASDSDPAAVPDWLVVGLEVPLIPEDIDAPGKTPDETSLFAEGCADVDPMQLLESWTRHMLVWINRWSDEGGQPLHAEWRGMAHGLGEGAEQTLDGSTLNGTFLGVDENFAMLLRVGPDTKLIPLTTLLEDPAP